jgi:magnesium-transporting ATPase (P-type)
VTVLADAEAAAGSIERPPLRLAALQRANVTAIDRFLDGCASLWRRYVTLGACLLAVYALTATAYLAFIVGGYSLVGNSGVLLGWGVAAFVASSALIVWITLVNFFYLLTQMAIAVDGTTVRGGVGRVITFLRGSLREVAGIFGVVLVLVIVATVVSILATAGLGLIAFVPLAGLAVLPLQIAAWLLRGVVFQYLALTALGAYLTHYRLYMRSRTAAPARETSPADFQGKRLA